MYDCSSLIGNFTWFAVTLRIDNIYLNPFRYLNIIVKRILQTMDHGSVMHRRCEAEVHTLWSDACTLLYFLNIVMRLLWQCLVNFISHNLDQHMPSKRLLSNLPAAFSSGILNFRRCLLRCHNTPHLIKGVHIKRKRV